MATAASPYSTRGRPSASLPPNKRPTARGTTLADLDEEEEEVEHEAVEEAVADPPGSSKRATMAELLAMKQKDLTFSNSVLTAANQAFERQLAMAEELNVDMNRCIMDWYEVNKERLNLDWQPSGFNTAGFAALQYKDSLICVYFASDLAEVTTPPSSRALPVRHASFLNSHLQIAHKCLRACVRVCSASSLLQRGRPWLLLAFRHRCIRVP